MNANRSGFDLAAERRRAFAAEGMDPQPAPRRPGVPVLGLPAALGVASDMPLWRRFFAELGVPVVTSEGAEAATTIGRNVEGAEFCAPLASLHGHAAWLAGRADWLFLPVRLEELRPGEEARRPYCYYTQFSPALVSALARTKGRALTPYADWTVHRDRALRELAAALSTAGVDVTEQRVARRARVRDRGPAAGPGPARPALPRGDGRRPGAAGGADRPAVHRARSRHEQGHPGDLRHPRGEDLLPGHGAARRQRGARSPCSAPSTGSTRRRRSRPPSRRPAPRCCTPST